jgi:anaerobic magnesium-protoporphyrin IX monomethyl ester cyclase
MPEKIDIVLINPGDKRQVYQELGDDYSAIETPFWVVTLAAYLRNNRYRVVVIDAHAQGISSEDTALKVKALNPLLSAVIVYGAQPSASTQNMTIAGKICKAIKENTSVQVAIGGLHPSALPLKTIQEENVDFVIDGEGPFTLLGLIKVLDSKRPDFAGVPGLWYRQNGAIKSNPRAELVKDLDKILPVAAWDLLPMDKYRAHNWHCFDDLENRKPYAAIYTSLGCPYNCIFCCINAPFGGPGIRYRSPELVIQEIELLVKQYKVKNIKIADELFVLDEKHYMRIVDLLIAKGFDLNLWAYARVDTVKSENLIKMKKAGINWLALGIESANSAVRDGASKQMRISDIKRVVKDIQEAGIRVIGNFIFGLLDDSAATMQETLDLAMGLNCEFVNFYCAMAYPGSGLYELALQEGWLLPGKWQDFSQYSYDSLPLPTKHITAREVLKFRDEAFHKYFCNPDYLNMLTDKFGPKVRAHIEKMAQTRLKRRLFE